MDFLRPTIDILCLGSSNTEREVRAVLEDAESPTTRKAMSTLYKYILDKSHVDFGDIPKSKGNITKYSGYDTMMEVLNTLKELAASDPTYKDIRTYAEIITTSISILTENAKYYEKAFANKINILMIEYNTFVYACVEATTAILYQFADFMKTPSSHELKVTLKNAKYRADLFFIDQLKEFNRAGKSGQYQTYLSSIIKSGQENFILDGFAVGSIALVSAVIFTIVPVTRRLIYTIQDMRGRLAEALELQAYFLELNKSSVQAQQGTLGVEKTKKILAKQEAVRIKFLRLADKLRVKSLQAQDTSAHQQDVEDRSLTIKSAHDDVSDDDIVIV